MPSSMFSSLSGALHCEGVNLEPLAKSVGTPTYIYSRERLVANARAYQDAFGAEGGANCFAMKANSSLGVMAVLAGEGIGADASSLGELAVALKAGAPPEHIIYTGLGKTPDGMRAALEHGVRYLIAESLEELRLLDEVARSLGLQAPTALRFNPDVDAETHPALKVGKKESQFGFDADQLRAAVSLIGDLPNVALHGLSYHIGSQLESLAPFVEGAGILVETVRELRQGGHEITCLDIGGGLGIAYEDQALPTPGDLAEAVLPLLRPLGCAIFTQPGRSLVGDAGALLARVLYRKHADGKHFLILDAGMNDLIRPALYGAVHQIVPVTPVGGEPRPWQVIGPVCECDDVFAAEVHLPELPQGALVAIRDAGAYGFAMASNYNGRMRPAEVMIEGSTWRIIRPRETTEDFLAGQTA